MRILQARILELVATPSSRGSSQPMDWTQISLIAGTFFTIWAPGSPVNPTQFSCSIVSDSLRPHGLQHARFPYPSSTPRAYSNSCSLSRWCHPTGPGAAALSSTTALAGSWEVPADRGGVLEVKRVPAQWGFITSQMTHHSIIATTSWDFPSCSHSRGKSKALALGCAPRVMHLGSACSTNHHVQPQPFCTSSCPFPVTVSLRLSPPEQELCPADSPVFIFPT